MAFNIYDFTATDTADATMKTINHLIQPGNGWTDLGTQTLPTNNRVNYGGTLYQVTGRGIRNSLDSSFGFTFFTLTSAGYMSGGTSHPCYVSHLNTAGNFIPWNASQPHANEVLNLRVCGAFAPNVNDTNNSISTHNSYKLFFNNTSFVLIHNTSLVASADVNSSNWMFRCRPRALVCLTWQDANYRYATIFNDFYTALSPFNQNRVNMITLIVDKATNQATYYYNDSRHANIGNARSMVLHTNVTTGLSWALYPSGAETRIGASSIKLRIGNMDVDMPNLVIFFVSEATLSQGVILDFTPAGSYQCYRLLDTSPRFYIGVKIS